MVGEFGTVAKLRVKFHLYCIARQIPFILHCAEITCFDRLPVPSFGECFAFWALWARCLDNVSGKWRTRQQKPSKCDAFGANLRNIHQQMSLERTPTVFFPEDLWTFLLLIIFIRVGANIINYSSSMKNFLADLKVAP